MILLILSASVSAEPVLLLAQVGPSSEQEDSTKILKRLAEHQRQQGNIGASSVFEQEMATLKQELRHVSNELEVLKQTHSQVLQTRARLREQKESLKQIIREKDDLLIDANNGSANIDAHLVEENTKFREKVIELESQKASFDSELMQIEKQNERASKAIKSLEKYRKGYEILKRRFSESRDLQDSVDRLVTSNKRLQLDLKKTKIDLKIQQQKLNDTEARVDRLSLILRRKKSEYAALEKLHEQLADSHVKSKTKVAQLEDKLRVIQRGDSSEQSSCVMEETRNTELKKRLSGQEAVYEELRKRLSGQEAVYDELRNTISTQINRVAELEEQLLAARKGTLAQSVASGAIMVPENELQQLREAAIELVELRDDNAQLTERVKKAEQASSLRKSDYGNVLSEIEKQKGQILSFEEQVGTQKTKITTLEKKLSVLQDADKMVGKMRSQITDMQQRYNEANNLVMLKDTELRMLKGRATAVQPKRRATPQPRSPRGRSSTVRTPRPTPRPTPITSAPPTAVISVRVIADKVNLRLRPGEEHSPLQQVGKGTELVVEAKVGEWFQVITPTGRRAYVRSDLVKQVGGSTRSPRRRTSMPTRRTPALQPGMVPFGGTVDAEATAAASAEEQSEEDALAIQLLKDAMRNRE